MALISYADSDHNIERLIRGLPALVDAHTDAGCGPGTRRSAPGRSADGDGDAASDAFLDATEMVPWREAVGRVSAEIICPHLPRNPDDRARRAAHERSGRPPRAGGCRRRHGRRRERRIAR